MRSTGLDPIYNKESQILILGTFPGRESLKRRAYYSDRNNQFWKIIYSIYQVDYSENVEDRKKLLLDHHIALWDVLKECDRVTEDGKESSSDKYIINEIPNDIQRVISESKISTILINGKTKNKGEKAKNPYKYYMKYVWEKILVDPVLLPSTSGLNTNQNLEEKIQIWKEFLIR